MCQMDWGDQKIFAGGARRTMSNGHVDVSTLHWHEGHQINIFTIAELGRDALLLEACM